MKKFTTIVTVGALACTFIFAVGIFTVGADEACWQMPAPDLEILRLDYLAISGGNYRLNGFLENTAGEVVFILFGSGRVVGTDFIAHLSGSENPTSVGTIFGTWSGTLVLDFNTGTTTMEGITQEADRITEEVILEYDGPEAITRINCPSP